MFSYPPPQPELSQDGVASESADFAEMGWAQLNCFFDDDGSRATGVCYDAHSDILWTGHSSGRVTSYMHMPGAGEGFTKFSSFQSSRSPVVEVQPMYRGILACFQQKLQMNDTGGVPLATFQPYDEGGDQSSGDFSAIHFMQTLSHSGVSPSSILAGTSTHFLNVYDINMSGPPVGVFDVGAPVSKVQSSPLYVAVSGTDGKVRLMDGQLRSPHVIHSLSAHSGSVLDMCLPFDGYYMATCGLSGRAINPYDPSSPFIYSADPAVTVFDLRMPELGTPLSSVSIMPSFVRFLPSGNWSTQSLFTGSDSIDAPAVVLASTDGCLQVLPLCGNFDPIPATLSPIGELGLGEVSSISVAPSGRMVALGTDSGAVVQLYLQHVVTEEEENVASRSVSAGSMNYNVGSTTKTGSLLEPIINIKPELIELPTYFAPEVPRQISLDDPSVGTSYSILDASSVNFLSSSFASTPKFANKRLRTPVTRRIHQDLLAKTSFQEFLGSVANPDFPANSMIFGPSRAKAYQPCDPRYSSGLSDERMDSAIAEYQYKGDKSRELQIDECTIPTKYRRVQSHRGRDKMKQFQYQGYNMVDSVVGLENSIQRPWINPMIQLLYSIPKIRQHALDSQTRGFHHSVSPYSLWCELGLLFHMIGAMSNASSAVGDSIIKGVACASNFHTIFKHSAAAAAVGLLKDTLSYDTSADLSSSSTTVEGVAPGLGNTTVQLNDSLSPTSRNFGASSTGTQPSPESYSVRMQQTLQIFVKFLLQQLSKEAEIESKHNLVTRKSTPSGKVNLHEDGAIQESEQMANSSSSCNVADEVFGITVNTSTKFLRSGTVDDGASHQTHSVELAYPPVTSTSSKLHGNNNKMVQAAMTEAKMFESLFASSPFSVSVTVKANWTVDAPSSAPSFGAILWLSLQKELYMRGWCAASDSYEPFRQTKSVDIPGMPPMLVLLCGDTVPVALPTADTPNPTSSSNIINEKEHISKLWRGEANGMKGTPWLGSDFEILKVSSSINDAATSGMLLVSERLELPESNERWLIFTGSCYISSPVPASILLQSVIGWKPNQVKEGNSDVMQIGDLIEYELCSVLSHIDDFIYNGKRPGFYGQDGNDICCHSILHLKRSTGDVASDQGADWVLFNDFSISPSTTIEALEFTHWRHPDVLFLRQKKCNVMGTDTAKLRPIPEKVLTVPSLSSVPSVPAVPVDLIPRATIVYRGLSNEVQKPFVAFDAEFVTVEVEEIIMGTNGKQVTGREGRQVIARISVLAEAGRRSNSGSTEWSCNLKVPFCNDLINSAVSEEPLSVPLTLLSDDYVLPAEPIVDYVTRFSGLTCDDLNPAVSRHPIITHRAAILKLRYYVDSGCIFVGHGLTKDFETANIFVPPEQIRDTVELWRLPNQRKISLRFLAAYLLKADIQDELHDSIEDAKTAYALYLFYERCMKAVGPKGISAILRDLYIYGNQNNWTLGMERIS